MWWIQRPTHPARNSKKSKPRLMAKRAPWQSGPRGPKQGSKWGGNKRMYPPGRKLSLFSAVHTQLLLNPEIWVCREGLAIKTVMLLHLPRLKRWKHKACEVHNFDTTTFCANIWLNLLLQRWGKKPAQVSPLTPKPCCECQFLPRSKWNKANLCKAVLTA
jgi:hypothetical protein